MNAHIRELSNHSPIGRLNERPEPYGISRSFQEQRFDSIFSVPRSHHRPHHHNRHHRGYDYDQRPMMNPFYYGQPPQGPSFGQVAGGCLKGAATGAMIGSVVPGIGTVVGGVVGGIIGGIGKLFG